MYRLHIPWRISVLDLFIISEVPTGHIFGACQHFWRQYNSAAILETTDLIKVLVLLLYMSLACLSQTKITFFRLVQIRLPSNFWPVGLSRPVTIAGLKIVVFFWDRHIKPRQTNIPGALFVSMVFDLSTLFCHLQKRQQPHRSRRRGLLGPLQYISSKRYCQNLT